MYHDLFWRTEINIIESTETSIGHYIDSDEKCRTFSCGGKGEEVTYVVQKFIS